MVFDKVHPGVVSPVVFSLVARVHPPWLMKLHKGDLMTTNSYLGICLCADKGSSEKVSSA